MKVELEQRGKISGSTEYLIIRQRVPGSVLPAALIRELAQAGGKKNIRVRTMRTALRYMQGSDREKLKTQCRYVIDCVCSVDV